MKLWRTSNRGFSSGATEDLGRIMSGLGGVKNGRINRDSSEEIFEGIQERRPLYKSRL